MMSKDFNKSQKLAIAAREGTIVVSAAAGSGKTTVLIERIIKMILSGECSVDELLIVTFTRAATAEIRSRLATAITKALSDNPNDSNLKKQEMLVPSANIFTIDAFCGNIVRENFEKSGVAPDFKTLDSGVEKALIKEALDKTLDKYYLENSDELNTLNIILKHSSFGGMDIEKCVKLLYEKSKAYVNSDEVLDRSFELFEFSGPIEQSPIVQNAIKDFTDYADYILKNIKECLKYFETVECGSKVIDVVAPDVSTFETVYNYVKEAKFDEALKYLDDFKTGAWPSKSIKDYANTFEARKLRYYRDLMNDTFLKKKEGIIGLAKYFGLPFYFAEKDRELLLPALKKLIEITKDFKTEYDKAKAERNALDFGDIEHKAYDLLIENGQKTALAKYLSSNYHQILIDEYQDTNELQDAIFKAISKDEGNLFMVGDIKQSIYGFRNAMPELFLEKKNKYPIYDETAENKYPATIILEKNYRSSAGIIDYVNFVFEQIMSEKCGSINYQEKSEQLVCGKEEMDPKKAPDVELHLFKFNSNQSLKVESQFVIDYIKGEMKKNSSLTYNDFAILMRTVSSRGEKVSDALEAAGIPVIFDGGSNFLETADIKVIISLLRVIDNPLLNVDMLAVLMSPIFNFSADDIATIRNKTNNKKSLYSNLLDAESTGNEKCKNVCDTLRLYRKLSISMPIGELLRKIYEETLYPEIVLSMSNGLQRRANLLLLRDYADSYEGANEFGVAGFVRYLDSLIENELNPESASLISGETNAVRLMTIHKSKGLEFKHCIVMDLGHSKPNSDNLIFDKKMRIGIKACNPITEDIFPSFNYKAVANSNIFDDISEELRVLYVALTRAEDRLILLGTMRTSKFEEKLVNMATVDLSNPQSVAHASNLLELVLYATSHHINAYPLFTNCDFNPVIKKSIMPIHCELHEPVLEDEEAQVQDQEIDVKIDESMKSELIGRMSYEYPYIQLATVPTKRSASATEASGINDAFFASAKPDFIAKEKLTAAQKGTCLHRFMQFANFDNAKADPANEIARLQGLGYLTENEAITINSDKVSSFFKSDIYKRISASDNVMREKKFAVLVPASKFNPSLPEELGRETVLIQGIADCVFEEDGKLIIVDYKTDRTTNEEELIERHKPQLSTYKDALEEVLGKEVAACYIYAFSLDKEIKVI